MPSSRSVAVCAATIATLAAAACADDVGTAPARPSAPLAAVATYAAALPSSDSGIDCRCLRTGAYANPSPGKAVTTGRDGSSPSGRYQLTASSTGDLVTIQIRKSGALVKEIPGLPASAAWGFSPDDDRFVYHYVDGTAPNQMHRVRLLDLAASGAPVRRSFDVAAGGARIAFSPGGKRLLYARLGAPTLTNLTLVDATSGATRYETAFTFQVPAGTPRDTVGMVSWGFGPDGNDRTFVYRYAVSSTLAAWNVVNLARSASAALVRSENGSIAGLWQFSPCGDVLAIARQPNATQLSIGLARTLDGSDVSGSSRVLPLATPTFASSGTAHRVTTNGTTETIAPNVADDPCGTTVAPALSGIALSPSTVRGGTASSCTVTLTAAAPTGGLVVTLASSNRGVASVPASITVPAGSTTASVAVPTTEVAATTSVTITGTAGTARTATLTVTAPPPPTRLLTLGVTSLGFANQPVGTTSGAQSVNVTNVGTLPVAITSIVANGDFARSSACPIAPATLPVGGRCTIDVTFTPTTGGTRVGAITVNSDADGSPHVVTLLGSGYAPAAVVSIVPGSLGFGSIPLGTATSGRVVKLTSTGTAPLVVASASLTGANPSDFTIASDGCTGVAVAPGGSCTILVSFEPFAIGTRTATLTIAHNALGGPSAVALSGSAYRSPGGIIP